MLSFFEYVCWSRDTKDHVIEVTIMLEDGSQFQILTERDQQVNALKDAIHEKTGIHPNDQELVADQTVAMIGDESIDSHFQGANVAALSVLRFSTSFLCEQSLWSHLEPPFFINTGPLLKWSSNGRRGPAQLNILHTQHAKPALFAIILTKGRSPVLSLVQAEVTYCSVHVSPHSNSNELHVYDGKDQRWGSMMPLDLHQYAVWRSNTHVFTISDNHEVGHIHVLSRSRVCASMQAQSSDSDTWFFNVSVEPMFDPILMLACFLSVEVFFRGAPE